MKLKLENKNGDPLFKTIAPRTRLKFSIAVIIANFIIGIIGIILGSDLTAIGVFLSLCNTPLYVYVLGESLKPTPIGDAYFSQQHGGAGGLGTIYNPNNQSGNQWSGGNQYSENQYSENQIPITQKPDEFNNQNFPQTNIPLQTVTKPASEIG